MIITIVPKEMTGTVWLEAGKHLQTALDAEAPDGRIELQDIFEMCSVGKANLWVVYNDDVQNDEIVAAFITHVIDYPNRKAMSIPWVGGSKGRLFEWYQQMLDTVEMFASQSGCQHMEGYGRDAWGKFLGREGWRKKHNVFEKEVD